jgi:hypothetical protein
MSLSYRSLSLNRTVVFAYNCKRMTLESRVLNNIITDHMMERFIGDGAVYRTLLTLSYLEPVAPKAFRLGGSANQVMDSSEFITATLPRTTAQGE